MFPFKFITETEELIENPPLIPNRKNKMKKKTWVCTSNEDESSESDSEQAFHLSKRSFSDRKNNAVNTPGVNHNTGLNSSIEHMRITVHYQPIFQCIYMYYDVSSLTKSTVIFSLSSHYLLLNLSHQFRVITLT